MVMQAAGYETFAIAANINIGPEIGSDRGFDRFVTNSHGKIVVDKDASAAEPREMRARLIDGEAMRDKLLEWKADIEAAERSFVYLHFMDVHKPYHQREPWYRESERHTGATAKDVGAYDSEIRYLDGILADLYERFAWDEDTLLVILSDHGEAFDEHGTSGHGRNLHGEMNRVLMMWHSKSLAIAAQRVPAAVSLVDALPTITELIDGPVLENLDGLSLASMLVASDQRETLATKLDERTIIAHLDRGKVEHWAAVQSKWKFMLERGNERFYDVEQDPAEVNDLVVSSR